MEVDIPLLIFPLVGQSIIRQNIYMGFINAVLLAQRHRLQPPI
jgi:hypothetical protein